MAAVLETKVSARKADRLDQAAICLSGACLVHCLAVPVLLMLAPWISVGFFGEKWFHLALVAFVVPISLFAFRVGLRQHGQTGILLPGLSGLGLVTLAGVMEFAHIGSHELAAGITSVGGILLIIAHWRNLRGRRCLADRLS
ncbi:MAG: MerC domain-containing protein [Wenzhouxiangella sp.]